VLSYDIVKKIGLANNFPITELSTPFRWSEDFGIFTDKYKGAFFGIGAGKECPQLHNPDYDFPDDIIGIGIKMFYGIILDLLNNDK